MAEQEIIKHTDKAIKALQQKNVSIWHKIKDALSEIAIIVFAISLSIWFHGWSEHRKEQKEVKSFLLGLKKDLQADVEQATDGISFYKSTGKIYEYISKSNSTKFPPIDSVKLIREKLNSNWTIRPHHTRFNGFLSSGKVANIEIDTLQLQILDYYQEIIPSYKSSEDGWLMKYNALNNFISTNVKDFDSELEKWQLLTSSKGRNIAKGLIGWPQLYERLDNIISEAKSIIRQIDLVYPNEK